MSSPQRISVRQLCGLENPPRAMHCFLNCVVQLLWHCRAFRAKLLLPDGGGQPTSDDVAFEGHTCLQPHCFLCLLRDVFREYALAEPAYDSSVGRCWTSVLPLRIALHDVSGGGFGMGMTADANEALMVILQQLHLSHSSQFLHTQERGRKGTSEHKCPGDAEADCNAKPTTVAADGSPTAHDASMDGGADRVHRSDGTAALHGSRDSDAAHGAGGTAGAGACGSTAFHKDDKDDEGADMLPLVDLTRSSSGGAGRRGPPGGAAGTDAEGKGVEADDDAENMADGGDGAIASPTIRAASNGRTSPTPLPDPDSVRDIAATTGEVGDAANSADPGAVPARTKRTQRIVKAPVPPPPPSHPCPQYGCIAHSTFFCYFCDQIQCSCGVRSEVAVYETHFGLTAYVTHVLEYRPAAPPPGAEAEALYFERVLGYAVERSLDPRGSSDSSGGTSYSDEEEEEEVRPNKAGIASKNGEVVAWCCLRCTFRNKPADVLCKGCSSLRPSRILGRLDSGFKWRYRDALAGSNQVPRLRRPTRPAPRRPAVKPAATTELPPKFECGTAGCPGTSFHLRRYLLNEPQVFVLNFVFTQADTHKTGRLRELLNRIGDPLNLDVLFDDRGAEMAADKFEAEKVQRYGTPERPSGAVKKEYWMRGIVCYGHLHYVSFFFYPKYRTWFMYDDSRVRQLETWAQVKDVCVRSNYLPVMVFYELGDAVDDDAVARAAYVAADAAAEATWKRRAVQRVLPTATPVTSHKSPSPGGAASPADEPMPAVTPAADAEPGAGTNGGVAGDVAPTGAQVAASPATDADESKGDRAGSQPAAPMDASSALASGRRGGVAEPTDAAQATPSNAGADGVLGEVEANATKAMATLEADAELARKLQEKFDKEEERLVARLDTYHRPYFPLCRACRAAGLTGSSSTATAPTDPTKCGICKARIRAAGPTGAPVTRTGGGGDRFQTTYQRAYGSPTSSGRTGVYSGSPAPAPAMSRTAVSLEYVRCVRCGKQIHSDDFIGHRRTCPDRVRTGGFHTGSGSRFGGARTHPSPGHASRAPPYGAPTYGAPTAGQYGSGAHVGHGATVPGASLGVDGYSLRHSRDGASRGADRGHTSSARRRR